MHSVISTLFLSLISNGLIYVGLAFVSGKLLPVTLQTIYENSGYSVRVISMTILFALPANFLFSAVFMNATPTIATMSVLGTLVLVMCANIVFLGDALTTRAMIAALATLLCALWLGYEFSSV